MHASLFLLMLAFAPQDAAPPPPAPEIRGLVIEADSKQPIVGAQVSVYFLGDEKPRIMTGLGTQTALDTVTTDFSGSFDFHLSKPGYYAVAAKKDGYNSSGGGANGTERLTIGKNDQVQEVRLTLGRPGSITGVVTDDQTHKPMANIHVWARSPMVRGAQRYGSAFGGFFSGVTGADGSFTIKDVHSGQYVVEIRREKEGKERLVNKFEPDDWKTVDEDQEHSVWPGGKGDDAAVPVQVGGGFPTDAGSLRVRKIPYYRLHVKMLPSTCGPSDTMQVYEQVPGSMLTIANDASCSHDFMLTGFAPGAYQLLLAVNSRTDATREMAAIPFVIEDKGVEVAASLQRGVTIDCRFVATEGANPADWQKASITLRPQDMLPFVGLASPHKAGADGKVQFAGMPVGRFELSTDGISGQFYVKEVRYNGFPVTGRILKLDPSAMAHTLTIVVDDKAATISGTVTKGDEHPSKPWMVLMKWPIPADETLRPTAMSEGDEQGHFQIGGLTPGEYHVVALASREEYVDASPQELSEALARAPKIEISAGNSLTANVTLTKFR